MFKKYYYNNSALIIYIIEEKVKFYAIVINGFYKYFKEMFQRFVIKVKKKQQKSLVKKTANDQIIRLLLIKGE